MQELIVQRDSVGRIKAIGGAVTKETNLRLLGGSLLLAGCGAVSAIIDLALPWQGQDFLASKADLMVLALGLCFFVIVAMRFLPGGRTIVLYATTDGLVFRFFDDVTATWAQVQGFHWERTDSLTLAPEILVADVFGNQDWTKGRYSKKRIIPPGTLASSKTLDLAQLESALEAMRAQCQETAGSAAPIKHVMKSSEQSRGGAIVGVAGIILLVFAGMLHQHMVGAIAFPNWLRWVTPDWLVLYALLGFLFYRKFIGTPLR